MGREKAARGKTPTDVWWQTIVSPTGKEKTGYPTQKPLAILERIVKVHSDPGDLVVDFFAGSGTTGEAAARNGRGYLLVDVNPEAVRVMAARLAWDEPGGRRLRARRAPRREGGGAARRPPHATRPAPRGAGLFASRAADYVSPRGRSPR